MSNSPQPYTHKENLFALITHYGETCADLRSTLSFEAQDLLDLIRRELFREELLAELDQFVEEMQ